MYANTVDKWQGIINQHWTKLNELCLCEYEIIKYSNRFITVYVYSIGK